MATAVRASIRWIDPRLAMRTPTAPKGICPGCRRPLSRRAAAQRKWHTACWTRWHQKIETPAYHRTPAGREATRRANRRQVAKRRALGLCHRCGIRQARPNTSRCQACHEKNVAAIARFYRTRRVRARNAQAWRRPIGQLWGLPGA